MKSNILKKIAVISMSAFMLTACMSKAPSEKKSTDVDVEKSVADSGPLGKYDPEINVSFVRSIDDDLATNILPKTKDETIEKNRWLDEYKDALGINITYDWTVKGGYTEDTYKQKMNLTLSSGDLPDVIKVDATTLKQLALSGEIEDLSEEWDEYASELTKEIYQGEGSAVLDSATIDGKLMGIPEMDSSLENAHYLWIRQDWLDKLNLEGPKTMDDLLKIAEAFTNDDPDGNGKDDTIAFAFTKDFYSGWGGTEGFFAGFHAYPNIWIEKDGKLEYGSVQPEVKDALQTLSELYRVGQLDKEFGIKEGGIVAEMVADGKVGIDFGEQWNPMYPLISNHNNDPEAEWQAYPIVSVDDKKPMVPLGFRTQLYYAVRKDFQYPEVPVKMVNLYTERVWGTEDNEFEKFFMPQELDNVGVWKFSPVTPAKATNNLDIFTAIDEARKNNTEDELTGEAKVVYENVQAYLSGDEAQWGWEKIYGENGAFRVMQQYRENDQLLYTKFVGAPTETMIEKRSTLEKMEKEVFIKIIMGEASIDDFDTFVEDYYKLGGEAITKEVNEWYESIKE